MILARILSVLGAALLSTTFLLLLVSGCGGEGKMVLLTMKFQPGQELVYDRHIEQTISIGAEDSTSHTSKSHGEMRLAVREVLPDGHARIEEESSWSWTEVGEDGSVNVVSKGESLIYTMAPNGKISELEIVTDGDASQWKEYAESNLEQSQPTFPEDPVGVGYAWLQSVKIFRPDDEKLDASTTYKIREFRQVDGRNCAVIDYSGNLILPFDVIESDSLKRVGVDRVDVTGTLWFDYDNGCVFSQHEHTTMTAERSKITANAAKTYTAYVEGDIYWNLKSAN